LAEKRRRRRRRGRRRRRRRSPDVSNGFQFCDRNSDDYLLKRKRIKSSFSFN